MTPRDLSGQRFGRLTVLSFSHIGPSRDRFWNCQCDCGGSTTTAATELNRGRAQSCGCIGREKIIARNLKHGMTETPEYVCWRNIQARCTNAARDGFNRYGGRGIRVCERWLSFENFFADMGPRPSSGHSIERLNNDGNYEPSNCVWATATEQALNRRPHQWSPEKKATHCPLGHAYDEQNTRRTKAGGKVCRICEGERNRRRAVQR